MTDDFQPRQILEIIHESFRFQGGNEFKLPVNLEEISEDGESSTLDGLDPSNPLGTLQILLSTEEGQYYGGAFTSSILLVVFMLLWCLSLPFVRCFWRKKERSCLKLYIFYISLNISTFSWFLSITGNDFVKEGILVSTGNAEKVAEELSSFVSDVDAMLALGPEIDQLKEDLVVICEPVLDAVGVSSDEIDLSQIPGSEDLEAVREPRDQVEPIPGVIEDISLAIEGNIGTVETLYGMVAGSIICFLIIFNVSTLVSYFCRYQGGCVASLNRCLNNIGCIVIFTVGLFFVFITVLLLFFIATVATVGADACIPDLTTSIVDQVQPILGVSIDDACFFEDFEALDEKEIASWFICHYTKCDPIERNILFEVAGVVLDNQGKFAEVEFIKEIEDELSAAQSAVRIAVLIDVDGAEECEVELNKGVGIVEQLEGVLSRSVNIAACSSVTPLLATTINNGLCNGIISGLGVIYLTWTFGIVTLMISLCAYIQIDFRPDLDIDK